MAFRFTIGRKIGTGFAVLIFLTIVVFVLTIITLTDSKKKTNSVISQVTPSVAVLKEFNSLLLRSQSLVTKWYFIRSADDHPTKQALKYLTRKEYPELKVKILDLSKTWTPSEKEKLKSILNSTDELFDFYQREIMSQLKSFDSYGEANILFIVKMSVDEAEDKLSLLYLRLDDLISTRQNNAETVTEQMFKSFNFLENLVKFLSIALVLGGILIAVFTARSIVKPVQQLKKLLLSMGMGILPRERMHFRRDEIGEMGGALNGLIESLESTTEFANQTGAGNFNAYFKPLSQEDVLGHALLKMRDDLATNERKLEQKVQERTEEVVAQKEEIEIKNRELETLYKQVTDSIHYAKRIQEAILPPDILFKTLLPDSFVLYKPKDIVSGDFYWLDQKADWVYVAAVDCTGHGVPGAFMSIVGYNLLKDIIKNTDIIKPSEIMDLMNEGVASTLHTSHTDYQTRDGMDLCLCAINFKTMEMQFACAYNPLYLVREGRVMHYKADKFPVGRHIGETKKFTHNTVQLQPGDEIFIFSDGYADQFGGTKGKKFMAGNFRSLLLSISPEPAEVQKQILNSTIEHWKGNLEQVDDILVIGIKV